MLQIGGILASFLVFLVPPCAALGGQRLTRLVNNIVNLRNT